MAETREAEAERSLAGGRRRDHRLPGAVWFVLAGVLIVLSAVCTSGADLLWGVAMGDRIRNGQGVPQSVPFAEAPSSHWANPMALGEVVLSAVHSVGPSALVILHLTLVATALGMLLACGVAQNQREARASLAVLLVAFGGVATFAVARMPSLSFVPYAALVVILVHEAHRPSRRLWLAVPVLGLWGNLHGGVLVGCALLVVHLVCSRGPRRRRAAVGVSALAAVLFATSAGWRTIGYYRGVLTNQAAQQHVGLWARPSLNRPFDLVMVLAVTGLIAMWVRSRPQMWEIVAVLGMIAATATASRNSVWLLLLLLPLAARGRSRMDTPENQWRPWKPASIALVLLVAGAGWQISARGPALDARGASAVPAVRKLAAGGTVLATDPVDETFAQAGIRIWAGNPIDSFPPGVQRDYLTFVEKGTVPADASIDLVVVNPPLAGALRSQGWRQVASVAGFLIFKPTEPR